MVRPDTDDLISFLNEIAALDPVFMGLMIRYRPPCNAKLAPHPTLQVGTPGEFEADNRHHLGILGLLNGYCGLIEGGERNGWGPISALIETDGTVRRFQRSDAEEVV